jgi:hypothetical protein
MRYTCKKNVFLNREDSEREKFKNGISASQTFLPFVFIIM